MQRLLLPFLILLLPIFANADKVYLKNGNVVEGNVIHQDGAEVRIERGGSLIVITTDRVERVEREERAEGESSQLAEDARRLVIEGNPAEAWEKLLKLNMEDPDSAGGYREIITRAWAALLTKTHELLDGAGIGEASQNVALIEGDQSLDLIRKVCSEEQYQEELNKLRHLRVRQRGALSRQYRQSGNFTQARTQLNEALQLVEQGDEFYAPIHFEMGLVLRDLANAAMKRGEHASAAQLYQDSLFYYDTVQRTARSNSTMVQAAIRDKELVSEKLAEIRRLQSIQVTPTPTPKPYVPPPTPTPTPTPVPNFIGKVFGNDAQEKFGVWVEDIMPGDVEGDDVVNWALYVLIFVIGFWVIPWIIFKILVRRADFLANEWKGKVKYLGPIALVCYLVAFFKLPSMRRKKGEATAKPCPHCGFNLDNIMVYESLDFHHCPNCGGEIEPLFSLDDYIDRIGKSLATDAEKLAMGMVTMSSFVEKDLMQKLVTALITKSVRNRASDLHVEPQQDHVTVRYRIDGVMMELARFAASLGPPLVSAIKVNAELDISEKRKPQDGRMQSKVDDAMIDIRVASSPSPAGETVAMRLLDFRSIQMDPKRLGMTKSSRELFDRVVHEPHGLVIVCGPTGSGKTTTLYVALQTVATGDKNVISIEDPIEFRLPRINQIQVNPTAGLTFATGLRSILRQDPDILMIGEVRDRETAEIAVNAAQTGHLVFTSLHTIDAAAAVTRLFDLGIAPRQFSDALSLVVAQRLIRLVCPECKKPHKAKESLLQEVGLRSDEIKEIELVIGAGCETCTNTGYLGRTGLFEMLAPNQQIRASLEKGSITTAELRSLAVSAGMRTLREESLILLRNKMTTPEEVLRVTK